VGQLKSVHTFHSTLFTTIDIGSYSGPAEISPHISQYLIHNYLHWILQWASWNQSTHFTVPYSQLSTLDLIVGQLKSVHTFHSTLFTTIDIGSYSGPA